MRSPPTLPLPQNLDCAPKVFIYLNLSNNHFWWRDLGISSTRHGPNKKPTTDQNPRNMAKVRQPTIYLFSTVLVDF